MQNICYLNITRISVMKKLSFMVVKNILNIIVKEAQISATSLILLFGSIIGTVNIFEAFSMIMKLDELT